MQNFASDAGARWKTEVVYQDLDRECDFDRRLCKRGRFFFMKKEITEEVVYEDSSYVEEDIYEDEEEETSGSFETYEEEQNEQRRHSIHQRQHYTGKEQLFRFRG